MNLENVFRKQRRQRRALEIEAGAESGTDWATTLLFSCLHDKYKWRDKRLKDLQNYYKDKVYVLTHNEVPIWEFMKCLNVECNIDYPALEAYEKQNGPVDIYRGNRGER